MNKKILLTTILSCSVMGNFSYADDYNIISPGSEYGVVGSISKDLSEALSEVSNKGFDVEYLNYGSPQAAYKKAFHSTKAEAPKTLTILESPRFVSYIISHRSLYTLKSFYYYSSLFTSKYVIVSNNNGDIQNFDDIKNFCKKYPLNVSIAGIGDAGYMAFSTINDKYNCEIQYIPDKRYEKQLNTIKNNNANIGIVPLYMLLPILKKQKDPYVKTNLIPLAVLGDESSTLLPKVPTTASLGFAGLYSSSSLYIAGLASVSQPYHDLMQGYVNKALKNPAFLQSMQARGLKVELTSSQDVYEQLKHQLDVVSTYYERKPW